MVLAWATFFLLYRDCPTLRVFALFGCTHKTIAMGIPLITALYENSEKLALYTLPILIWHPTQLILGSLLAPRLEKWVEKVRRQRVCDCVKFREVERVDHDVAVVDQPYPSSLI